MITPYAATYALRRNLPAPRVLHSVALGVSTISRTLPCLHNSDRKKRIRRLFARCRSLFSHTCTRGTPKCDFFTAITTCVLHTLVHIALPVCTARCTHWHHEKPVRNYTTFWHCCDPTWRSAVTPDYERATHTRTSVTDWHDSALGLVPMVRACCTQSVGAVNVALQACMIRYHWRKALPIVVHLSCSVDYCCAFFALRGWTGSSYTHETLILRTVKTAATVPVVRRFLYAHYCTGYADLWRICAAFCAATSPF